MPSLCCFWCPASDFTDRELTDVCTTCGRPYGRPLEPAPDRIGPFEVVEPLTRGFYSAVYRARQPSLNRLVVLKVVSIRIYDFFPEKDWATECHTHAEIAQGTPFVTDITDQFDADVTFREDVLPCHVAVLENIPGPTLEAVLSSPSYELTARAAAQIAVDLFEILGIFTEVHRYHNDLHAGNILIQALSRQSMRSGALDPSIRAVAIDLGSVLDASRSDGSRLSDQHHVARHLVRLSRLIRSNHQQVTDVGYRIAGRLRGLAEHLAPSGEAQRFMTPSDALSFLRTTLLNVDEPWRLPLSLHRFGDAYNAQTMESWHVPELWFDPEDRWLRRTAARGPQVITGMRGCGKTMLLRALHFHARAVQAEHDHPQDVVAALRADAFVGLYASCQRLLNPQDRGASETTVALPFERLYVAYVRDLVQILRHLRSIAPDQLLGELDDILSGAIAPLDLSGDVSLPSGEKAFEQFLLDLQFSLSDGEAVCRLRMAPAEAFGHLAAVLRRSAPMFEGKYVLFLLDDVSTRYLDADMVRQVISQLLFQHADCAFRITTEAQAIQRTLLSPGGTSPADPNRDYEEFDLGNEVYRLLREKKPREKAGFVSEILRRRGRKFDDPIYRRAPEEVLGDVRLKRIAQEIASSSSTSPERKRVYRGIRALQAVCVGDLGDVVKLYEKILQKARPTELPVPPEKQTDCFLEHSAGLMHFLNRRDQHKKSLALAFAQASGELLQRSQRNGSGDPTVRLRQYTKLYVRIDARADFAWVADQLLDLLDAGVFVYDGGVPRTKTRDDDPVLQFKLSFRKLLGLASFIGLSDRDRFELSGDNLARWLREPDSSKQILLDSEARQEETDVDDDESEPDDDLDMDGPENALGTTDESESNTASLEGRAQQLDLDFPSSVRARSSTEDFLPNLGLVAKKVAITQWNGREVDAIILAQGFEERCRVSAERLFSTVETHRAVLIHYTEDQGTEVADLISRRGLRVDTVATPDELSEVLHGVGDNVIVDTSGLSKPFLFVAIRQLLQQSGHVSVAHTRAMRYYPRNEDLQSLGVTANQPITSEVFAQLGSILVGEQGPYRLVLVHNEPSQPERWRTLLASASPKNDRLLHLLDERTYDATRILVPPALSPRSRVARAAVEFAATAADSNVALIDVDTNDLLGALRAAETVYNELYYGSGANVEIGLTGSKVHAVAFAALAAAARVAYCWYVSPKVFDRHRFTEGAADTQCMEVSLRSDFRSATPV